MSEAKHTPSPWAVNDCAIGGPSITAGKSVIADIRTFGGVHVNGEQNSRTLANASLIAAAPDLLEALQGILGYFDSGNSVSVSQATIKARSDEVKSARAAIAKATGGAA